MYNNIILYILYELDPIVNAVVVDHLLVTGRATCRRHAVSETAVLPRSPALPVSCDCEIRKSIRRRAREEDKVFASLPQHPVAWSSILSRWDMPAVCVCV